MRSLEPDQLVTMEFDVERLNVDDDADGVVTDVRCGLTLRTVVRRGFNALRMRL